MSNPNIRIIFWEEILLRKTNGFPDVLDEVAISQAMENGFNMNITPMISIYG
jgi:hypothetical protein